MSCRQEVRSPLKLKKFSAITALLTMIALLAHIGYNVFAYLTFYYNPLAKALTALPIIVFCCLHAVAGMCSVFLLGDGTRIDPYQKQNRRTVVQRVSAALIFPLLIIHLKTFELLKSSAESGTWALFVLTLCAQLAFYFVTIIHVSTSFSRALVTLGLLSNRETQAKIDRVVRIVCVCLFFVAAFVVTKGQLSMFLQA